MFVFFFNDTATTEIYTLSLHDALPILIDALDRDLVHVRAEQLAGEISRAARRQPVRGVDLLPADPLEDEDALRDVRVDRKSTRLNSSHANISYAVFCLKKKKQY